MSGAALSRVGRDGHLRLAFERRGPGTVLTRSGFTLPLQVLAPLALDDPAAIVSVLNPTGSLLGGDRLVVEVEVGRQAHACLITPSATKVHRAEGEPAVQDVRLRVGAGAFLEWIPDHTIPFAGADFRQSIEVQLGEGAALVLVDAFSAGRVARGERWRFARLESALRIRDTLGWVLIDRFVLSPEHAWDGLGGTEGAPYFATIAIVGELDPGDLSRRLSGSGGSSLAVGTLPGRGALVRCLASDAPALGQAIQLTWDAARQGLRGWPAPRLRKA